MTPRNCNTTITINNHVTCLSRKPATYTHSLTSTHARTHARTQGRGRGRARTRRQRGRGETTVLKLRRGTPSPKRTQHAQRPRPEPRQHTHSLSLVDHEQCCGPPSASLLPPLTELTLSSMPSLPPSPPSTAVGSDELPPPTPSSKANSNRRAAGTPRPTPPDLSTGFNPRPLASLSALSRCRSCHCSLRVSSCPPAETVEGTKLGLRPRLPAPALPTKARAASAAESLPGALLKLLPRPIPRLCWMREMVRLTALRATTRGRMKLTGPLLS